MGVMDDEIGGSTEGHDVTKPTSEESVRWEWHDSI